MMIWPRGNTGAMMISPACAPEAMTHRFVAMCVIAEALGPRISHVAYMCVHLCVGCVCVFLEPRAPRLYVVSISAAVPQPDLR